MTKFKCYDCEESFDANSSDTMLNLLYDHYMAHHKAVIEGCTEEEKKAWMVKFSNDWADAEKN